jgi:hypothetical protein
MGTALRPRDSAGMHRALIAVAAALVLPASASAATYCVQNPDCEQAGGTAETSIALALNAATGNSGHDVISLGAGTFPGNFTVSDPEGVTISGLGTDKTVLTPTMFGPPSYPLTLTLDGPDRLTGVHISLPSADGPRGVLLTGGATADHIVIDGGGVTDAVGAMLDSGTLTDSTIDVSGDDGLGVRVGAGGGTAERDSISAMSAVYVDSAAAATVRMHALRVHTKTLNGSAVSVDNGDVQLTDSLLDVRASQSARALYVAPSGSGRQVALDARHLTIVADGEADQQGISAYAGNTATASVSVRDSLLYGLGQPIRRATSSGGTADLALDHVDRWPDHPAADAPDGGQLTDTNALAVDPGFTDLAGGDFSLGASSALVDAGTPGALDAGEPDTDLTGAPRIADGNGDCSAQRDVGALERAAVACPPPSIDPAPGPQPPPPTGADTTAPRLAGVKLRRRHRALIVRFRLSEPATVKVKAGKRVVARRLAAGARTMKVTRVSRRRLRVSLTATDPAGNRARLIRRIR